MNEKAFKVGDRRPIAARNLSLSKRVANFLASSGLTANTISVIGMMAGVAAGLLIASTRFSPEFAPGFYIAGAIFIFIRLLANMFDGMVAVILARPNPLGELFNEVPDRVSDSAILIGCGYATNSSSTAGYWAALFAMMTAYIRATGKCSGASQSFIGPLAKQQRMFLCIAACLICAFSPAALETAIANPVNGDYTQSIMVPVLWFVAAGSAYTCVRRLSSISRELTQGHP